MEDRSYDPNDKDTDQTKDTQEPRKAGESLLQYFLRKRETDNDPEKEESEESTEKSTKKRWRLFKGFFADMISSPEEAETTRSTPTDTLLPLGWQSIQSTEFKTNAPEPQTEQSEPETTAAETVPEASIAPDVEAADSLVVETPVNPSVAEQATEELDLVIEQTPNIEDTESPTAGAETRQAPTVEKETVVERGVGNALPVFLVGAEYFARKRADRKLEKKVEASREQLKQHTQSEALRSQQIESLVKQNREQLEKLKQERGMVKNERVTAIEARTDNVEHARPAVEETNMPNRSVEMPKDKERKVTTIVEKRPEAQETHHRLERAIERSHEIKDDQTAPGAVSVGSIMASQASNKQPAQSYNHVTIADYQQPGLQVIPDDPSSDIYKRAMKIGFWSAITIIIFALLAYLVVK